MKLDELLQQIGEFGPYQKRVYILAAIPTIFCAAESLSVIFIFFFPEHRCAILGVDNDTYSIQSQAHAILINNTIPLTDGKWDSCHLLTDDATGITNGTNGTISDMPQSNTSQTEKPCSRWVFDHSVFESTVATDFHLVCGQEETRAQSTIVSEMGTLCGMLICGILADRFGRKLAFTLSTLALFLGGIGIAFVNSLVTLNICRFILGIARTSTFVNGFVLGMEIVGPSKRLFAGMAVYFFWCVGAFYLCFFAYFIRTWRSLEIAVSIPAVILLPYRWLIPESPRWLMSKGKTDQAMTIFKKIAESNKIQMPAADDAENLLEEETHVPLWHAVRSRELMRRIFIVFINIFVNIIGYYGIALNITNLSGNIYVNFTISFALETLAYAVCLYAFQHLGRKTIYIICIVGGGACCTLSIVPVLLSAPSWVVVGLSMVGRFFFTISFTISYLYGAELFPTVIRSSAIGFCIAMARTANVLSPYLADLGLLVGGKFRDALPLVVMGSPAILVGPTVLWLPETRNTALPEQMEDLNNGPRKRRTSCGSPGPGSEDDIRESPKTNHISPATSVC